MLHLITGGSASGKSAFGEQAALETGAGCRYYVATMHPWGEESRERISRHQRQRAGKGFCTIEAYRDLDKISVEPGAWEDTVFLLECMSNLVANEQFEAGGEDSQILERILRGIAYLQTRGKYVIVITNEVFSDGGGYGENTMRYVRLLGQVNRRLAFMADQVTEVVYGIGVPLKEKRKKETEGKETEGRKA